MLSQGAILTDSQSATKAQRVVFFDLDGTLHQQDMFGSFLRFMLWHMPQNLLLVIPLLPVIAFGSRESNALANKPAALGHHVWSSGIEVECA